jgi:hypothetical protein
MNFFKNNTAEGGAMKCAINDCKNGNIVIHSQTKKNGRMWGETEPAKLLTMLETNHGIYEVITSFPHQVYFDVDDDKSERTSLEQIKNMILEYFPLAEFAVSGSITEHKSSYHIILSNYLIRNKEERETMKHIVKQLCKKDPAFDWKVYTPNRNMKCINQSKDDGRVQQIIENPDFRAHLITCFLPTNPLPFPELPEELELEIKIARAKSTFDLTTLPKMILAIPDDFDLELARPEQILQIFPLDKSFDHNYTHRIARFCFHSQIPFDVFLSWLQNKHTEVHLVRAKWENHWKQMTRFPPVSMSQIRAMLKYFYPTITKPKHMLRFQNAFILPHNHIQHIERIGQEHFNVPVKAKVFNIGMGQGKTAQTNQYLKSIVENGGDFIWITPNVALANNTLSRIAEYGVDCADYRKYKVWQKLNGILKDQKNLMICANSLHYIMDRTYHTIVIDEPETFFDKWFGDFMDKPAGTKRRNWEALINIFNHAQSIIFLDAFTSKKSIDFLRNFVGEDYIIYERPEIEITRTVEYIPDPEIMTDMLTRDIKNGMKAFIFYPYKNPSGKHSGMADLCLSIQETTGKTGQFYNADQDDAIKAQIANVNDAWKQLDFVITNNMITCGVNYDKEDFDICYLFVARFSQARDILQVSARSRYFSSRIIRICFMEKMIQPDAWLNDVEKMNHTIYTQLFNNILIEKKAPTRDSIQLLCAKAGYKQKTVKSAILRELQLEHLQLVENAQSCASYDNISRIGFDEAQNIENCMFAQSATMLQKFQLQRYYFDMGFKDEANNATILGEPALQFLWDNHLGGFYERIKDILWEDDKSIFARLAAANSYSGIFPPEELFTRVNRKKLQIPPDVREEIFKQFTFKFLTPQSTNVAIFEKLFNIAFGKPIITTSLGEDKHTEYSIHEYWNECVEFIKEFHAGVIQPTKPCLSVFTL